MSFTNCNKIKTKMEEGKKNQPYNKDYLAVKNAHEYDPYVEFQEEGHLYKCYNKFLGEWLDKNNSEEKIVVPLESVSAIPKSLFEDTYKWIAINTFKKEKWRIENDPTYEYFGVKSADELRARGSEATRKGTYMHEVFEIYINLFEQQRDEHDGDDVLTKKYMEELGDYEEIHFLFDFMETFNIRQGFVNTIYRTEMRMYDPVLNISGTADMIMRDRVDGMFIIIDWKRSKSALKKPPKTHRKPPTEKNYGMVFDTWKKIYNCPFHNYSLQLHLYRYILEKNYGFRVKGLALVVVNPDPGPHDDQFTIEQVPLTGMMDDAIKEYTSFRANFILEHLENQECELAQELKKRIVV